MQREHILYRENTLCKCIRVRATGRTFQKCMCVSCLEHLQIGFCHLYQYLLCYLYQCTICYLYQCIICYFYHGNDLCFFFVQIGFCYLYQYLICYLYQCTICYLYHGNDLCFFFLSDEGLVLGQVL